MWRVWGAIAVLWLAVAGATWAQQQPAPAANAPIQIDQFNGDFGVWEIAPTPGEALQQQQLLNATLTSLQPQRRGRLDVYLITLSLWSDPVFEREATQAEALLRQRFGAEGRSIILSAGVQGRHNYPAVTPTNIAAAIARVGQVIDPNEDLVVLFMTSHGQPDGAIAIRDGVRLQSLMRPIHLSSMLSRANIQTRVVIVSSCFSGQFIPPLANDNTIVLTAAAADRTSFGCQPQRDWTYFGDAYFNQAVRGGAPLLTAFDQAKVTLSGWETTQNLTPSNPQSSVGSRAADMLRRAEGR